MILPWNLIENRKLQEKSFKCFSLPQLPYTYSWVEPPNIGNQDDYKFSFYLLEVLLCKLQGLTPKISIFTGIYKTV